MRGVAAVALTLASCTTLAGLDDDYRLGAPASSSPASSTAAAAGGAMSGGGGGPLGPFGTPQPLADLNSTGNEDDPTVTADGLEIYFDSNRGGSIGFSDIWHARRDDPSEGWPMPVRVVELSSDAADNSPEISSDGLTMFLSSNRDSPDFNIYVSIRQSRSQPWPTPQLVDNVNSGDGDYAVAFTPDLLSLFVTSTAAGTFDLYRTTRRNESAMWEIPQPLMELNGRSNEADPWIDASGTILYFTSDRAGMGDDIFVAERPTPNGSFATPTIVPELQSASQDQDPWLSPDMRTIVFASNRTGSFDLYIATR